MSLAQVIQLWRHPAATPSLNVYSTLAGMKYQIAHFRERDQGLLKVWDPKINNVVKIMWNENEIETIEPNPARE